MFNNAVLEVFRNHLWDIYPPVVPVYKDLLVRRVESGDSEANSAEEPFPNAPYVLSSRSAFRKKKYIDNYDGEPADDDDDEEDGTEPDVNENEKVINVMRVNGPILRNGGMCSYGSKGHRDLMKNMADDERTIGHLFLIDSPGGSSDAKYDYEEGIEYARSKGQPVIAFINGMACSAAYALASMCDEIYYAGDGDIVGCIGTMAAGYFVKDGDVNFNGETYFERYAEGSPYKNREYRAIVNGDDTIVMKGLNKSCRDFQDMVRRMRPNVTDEQLKGDIYRAKNEEGVMVDRKNTMQGCVDRILALNSGEATIGKFETDPREPEKEPEDPQNEPEEPESEPDPDESPEGKKPKKPLKKKAKNGEKPEGEEDPDGEEAPEGDEPDEDPEEGKTTQNKNNKKQKGEMENAYPLIMESASLYALCADKEGGIYLQKEHAENIEKTIGALRQKENVLAAKMTEIKRLNEQIESLKKDKESALQQKESAFAEKEKELTDKLKKSDEKVSKLNAEIKDRDEQIETLSNSATESPKPQAGAPKSNASSPSQSENAAHSIYNDSMTLAEKVEARKKREEYLKKGIGI